VNHTLHLLLFPFCLCKKADHSVPVIEVFACGPGTQEAEPGGWQVPGQSGLQSKIMSQEKKIFLY
jgi:hypothetical protein